ncbi:MAG TPA: LPXTG cell wall anchor domain-containing protein [Pyrinomonadaceae bacterium]|nr:LPXTG cell wall anchor domain-containing protein [Pyrinomonadaceae bacterium]
MKRNLSLVLLLVLVPVLAASSAVAEDMPDAAQTADNLRLQLLDVQAKESELQGRARQLEEDIKPENIERSLAGVGSTKPEELREMRRRQISIELGGVRSQLKLLANSRERLEQSIRNAEALAYQQSAEGSVVAQALRMRSFPTSSQLGIAGGLAALMGAAFVVVVRRRRKSTL